MKNFIEWCVQNRLKSLLISSFLIGSTLIFYTFTGGKKKFS